MEISHHILKIPDFPTIPTNFPTKHCGILKEYLKFPTITPGENVLHFVCLLLPLNKIYFTMHFGHTFCLGKVAGVLVFVFLLSIFCFLRRGNQLGSFAQSDKLFP